MTTFPLSGSLAKWLSVLFTEGMAWPLGLTMWLLWLMAWSRSDGVSWILGLRGLVYSHPPSIPLPSPWASSLDELTSPKRRKGDLSTDADQQNCTKTRTIPATETSWPSSQPGDVSASSAGILRLGIHLNYTDTVVHCCYFVLDFLHSERWLLQIHKPMLQKKKLRISKTEWFIRLINISELKRRSI